MECVQQVPDWGIYLNENTISNQKYVDWRQIGNMQTLQERVGNLFGNTEDFTFNSRFLCAVSDMRAIKICKL